jgi:tetratricopeptide (TPR) repeat protein
MDVRLFGQLEAVVDSAPVPIRGTKQRALLALLALHRGEPVSADRLIDALWGDGQAAHPANALQAQIGQLRRTLGAAAIVTAEAGYALDIGPGEVGVRAREPAARGIGRAAHRASPGRMVAGRRSRQLRARHRRGGRTSRHAGRSGARTPADRHQPRGARRPRGDPGAGGRAGSGGRCGAVRRSRAGRAAWLPRRRAGRRRHRRLDDRFRLLTGGARTALPRQQTLRAVVDWSYDLLFEDERRLFARLAVFTGGCELAAAEAVCADEQVPAGEILDVLSRLVDKSLVTGPGAGGQARFSQLQTLRAYGQDRLDESGEAAIMRARHGAYYRQQAQQAHSGLRGATGPMWRDRVRSESGNLRAALDWLIAAGDADNALLLASGMAWLWFIDGDFAEGARWLSDALGANGQCRPEVAATAHVWHGYCVGMSSSPAAGVLEREEAVAALRASDDRGRLAEALVLCATVQGFAHQFGRSLEVLGEAQDLLEPAGHGWLLAAHDLIVAWNLLSLGRSEEAESAARSSLERFDAQGEVLLVVSPLNALASIAEARGDLDAASAAYEALLERCRATGQPLQVPFSLVALATLRARQGDDAAADGLYARRSDAASTRGCPPRPWSARRRSPVASVTWRGPGR